MLLWPGFCSGAFDRDTTPRRDLLLLIYMPSIQTELIVLNGICFLLARWVRFVSGSRESRGRRASIFGGENRRPSHMCFAYSERKNLCGCGRLHHTLAIFWKRKNRRVQVRIDCVL
jgi:hypothetical protein